ncbi:uncharacterized protein LOC142344032 isoform X3 [Convolutriloba macropyga]|uniref:uncharacterized protein LOC142344032 isoform X3 n=1 Tax=Convolutriloba macropyga TaxID=536237 RepID=UPI003F521A91
MISYDHVLVVLDHTSSMLTEGPQNSRVDLDISSRNKAAGSSSAQLNPNSPYFVARSYWTSAVENALEIRRVMQDIFYTSKNLCIIGFDSVPRVILDWNVGEVQSTSLSQICKLNKRTV